MKFPAGAPIGLSPVDPEKARFFKTNGGESLHYHQNIAKQ